MCPPSSGAPTVGRVGTSTSTGRSTRQPRGICVDPRRCAVLWGSAQGGAPDADGGGVTRAETRRRARAKGPSLWTLAAALVVIAMVSFTGATRVGGEVARLERAERLSFLVEARAYEQAALDSRTATSGAPGDEAAGRRAAAVRQELTAALAELAGLLPDDPAVARVRAAAVEWQAAVDTKHQLLAAGDLVAANRFDRAQAGPAFDRLAGLLRTTAASYSAAAAAAQGRSMAGTLAVVVAATLLSLV